MFFGDILFLELVCGCFTNTLSHTMVETFNVSIFDVIRETYLFFEKIFVSEVFVDYII